MTSPEELYKTLKQSIISLLEENNTLRNKNVFLERRVKLLERELIEMRNDNEKMKDKNEALKIANAISGNSTHRRFMKSKINHLTKEIDKCIQLIHYTNG